MMIVEQSGTRERGASWLWKMRMWRWFDGQKLGSNASTRCHIIGWRTAPLCLWFHVSHPRRATISRPSPTDRRSNIAMVSFYLLADIPSFWAVNVSQAWINIYILLDTVLATAVNKYSVVSARYQQSTSPCFGLVSQSRRMSAIFVGSCWWMSLVAACDDPVVAGAEAMSELSILKGCMCR